MSWNSAPSTSRSARCTRSAIFDASATASHEMTIDRVAVICVALRAGPHRRPLRQQPHDQIRVVQRLPHRDRPVALQQERDELVGRARGHGPVNGRPRLPSGRASGREIGVSLRADATASRSTSAGSRGERHRRRQMHLTVAQHDARRQRARPAATLCRRPAIVVSPPRLEHPVQVAGDAGDTASSSLRRCRSRAASATAS